jgi:hypothetical protein
MTLWDEQFLGRGTSTMKNSMAGYYTESFQVSDETYDPNWHDDWGENYWSEADYWAEPDWDQWGDLQHSQPEPPLQDDGADDPQLQDAMKAEGDAENILAQAQRTWAEAQRATALLRKDRGFGHQRPPNDGKCFICGGNHFARDCPDKYHPSYLKGKGKGKSPHAYMVDWETAELYYMKGKDKSKNKGKGKHVSLADLNAMWKGKGKAKQSPSRPVVNAYAAENQVMYGLELQETYEAQSNAATNMPPNLGLLDCGATASAGPETSVQKLINSVLAQDRGAAVTIAKYMRPYFRFGNGCWGQANFRVTISSKVSGTERNFNMYCLPDPKNVDPKNMVPVLLGMDHLSGRDSPESALTIDFNTGLAVESLNPSPTIHQLPSNNKGHYIRDIVYYLTLGHSNQKGHPTTHVMEGHIQSAELQTLEFHPVEFYDMSMSDHVHDEHVLERSRRNLMALHAQQHGHAAANAEATLASMCPRDSPVISNSTASASCVQTDHGAGTSTRTSTGCNQEGNAETGSFQTSRTRSARWVTTEGTLVPTPNNGHASELTLRRSLREMRMELGCTAWCATYVFSMCRRREAPAAPRRSRTL